jgi:asparagine synthase (glutamine-hydrolysing)
MLVSTRSSRLASAQSARLNSRPAGITAAGKARNWQKVSIIFTHCRVKDLRKYYYHGPISMCGIFLVASARKPIDRKKFRSALQTMEHRGPDAIGQVFEEIDHKDSKTFIGLGHTRLSIIDLDRRANQPFTDTDAAIVFNGEIYNFRELKSEFCAGERFLTSSDTEVLHKLLVKRGADALPGLNGQWAFAHLDRNAREIILSRDRFGKKPLFYFQSADLFIVSSNVDAIRTYLACELQFDRDYLESFLVFGIATLSEGQTPFTEISQIPPGFTGSFSLDEFELTTSRFFDFERLEHPGTDRSVLGQRLADAVKARLVSDRPVALLLSGGIDSSLILSVLKKEGLANELSCFIGDTGVSQDADYARESAARLGIDPNVITIQYDAVAFDDFLQIVKHQERPFELVGNLLAMNQMYKGISETDIKVVLDGTGADEIFGGYWDRYFPYALKDGLRDRSLGWLARSVAGNISEFRRFLAAVKFTRNPASAYVDPTMSEFLAGMASRAERTDPLANPDMSFTEAKRLDATQGRLQDWLWQNDRNSMTFGIEGRSPFMDVNLASYLMCGYKENFDGGFNKLQLRQQFSNFVPLPTQWRKQKQGFRWSPSKFMKSNRSQIFSCISGSSAASELLGKGSDRKMDELRESNAEGKIVQRLLSIAALENSSGAKL